MIQFRQKNYTLQEGHYTGPKDLDKIPGAVEVIGKSAIGGALAGTAIGAMIKDASALDGALSGTKWGALGGIAIKILLNYIHNPMTRLKFQDVDKLIRREFGIYRASGFTIGDTLNKRANLDDKFGFNDRNVTSYKLNFSIQDNQIIMYTFGITDNELENINKILDYYCKKYVGMKYDSTLINQKMNSYSARIIFTNTQVIANFIMELSNVLNTKINLLDNKALVSGRLEDTNIEEKEFSVKELNKYDILKILSSNCKKLIPGKKQFGQSITSFIMKCIIDAGRKLTNDDIVNNTNLPMPRKDFNNIYLESVLLKLHYIEGYHYTVGRDDVRFNISMLNGILIVTAPKDDKNTDTIDKVFWKSMKLKINRSDTGDVIVYSYPIESKSKFEFVIKKLMSTGINFNIFE